MRRFSRMPLSLFGGAERDRTDDLLLAKQVLSQLSYSPNAATRLALSRARQRHESLVGLDGFEPSTPALSRRCSNQLSYRPGFQESEFRGQKSEKSTPRLCAFAVLCLLNSVF